MSLEETIKKEHKIFKQALETISESSYGASIVARDALGIEKVEVGQERWKCGPPGQPPVRIK